MKSINIGNYYQTRSSQVSSDIFEEGSPPPLVTCHLSCVMCRMSRVTNLYFKIFSFDKVVDLFGGGSVITGLPHLVFTVSDFFADSVSQS